MCIILHMVKKETNSQKILALAHNRGIIRVQDLKDEGIHPEHLRRMVSKGLIIQTGRGLYNAVDADISAHHSLAQVSKWVPSGVVCLLSALQFYNIGTQNPFEVWLALERKIARPRIQYPPLRIVHFSGESFSKGIEEHCIENITIKVYSPAKTLADCFKFRNKVGLDVAIEALRDCIKQRLCTNDELWNYSRICRVSNVMKPYIESMI
jgi:predicted transcriptional regulator of viral defense system